MLTCNRSSTSLQQVRIHCTWSQISDADIYLPNMPATWSQISDADIYVPNMPDTWSHLRCWYLRPEHAWLDTWSHLRCWYLRPEHAWHLIASEMLISTSRTCLTRHLIASEMLISTSRTCLTLDRIWGADIYVPNMPDSTLDRIWDADIYVPNMPDTWSHLRCWYLRPEHAWLDTWSHLRCWYLRPEHAWHLIASEMLGEYMLSILLEKLRTHAWLYSTRIVWRLPRRGGWDGLRVISWGHCGGWLVATRESYKTCMYRTTPWLWRSRWGNAAASSTVCYTTH